MANDLTHSEPMLYRVLRALGLAGVRESNEASHIAGADFAVGHPADRGYSAIDSLSTVAAFPFVHAAMNAVATDLSQLPLKVSVGSGANAEPVDDHPVLALLGRPSSRVSEPLLRRQLVTDIVLTGDGFLLVAGANEPEILLRLHPHRMKIVPLQDGQPSHYEYSGAGHAKRYEWDEILHFRQTSWEDDPKGLYGNGAIRALAADLTTDKLAADLAASSAKTGRPTTVFSPSEPDDRWSSEQIRILRTAYERQMKGTGGALFLGGSAKMESLSWSPRDMEYGAVRSNVISAILAVFDCPPTRVGLPSANYATSKEQAKRYYEGLQGRAGLIDGELTRLARMFPGWEDTDVRVYHDFSGVDALSESRESRVGRVLTWTAMGMPLDDAAAYEGFDDLPTADPIEGDENGDGDGGTAAPSDQPMAATALNGAQVASLLAIVGQVSLGTLSSDAAVALILAAFPTVSESMARRIVAGAQAAPAPEPVSAPAPAPEAAPVAAGAPDPIGREYAPPVTEDARAEVWRGFIQRVHDPISDTFESVMKKYLRSAGARAAKALKIELSKRTTPDLVTRANGDTPEGDEPDPSLSQQVLDDLLERVLDELREQEILRSAMAKPMREAFAKAVAEAVSTMPSAWKVAMSPTRINALADAKVGALVKDLRKDTAKAVRKVITTGISEGASMAEMQKQIMTSRAYAPSRALKIAQTETTASVNAGTLHAYEETVKAGFYMKYEWLSARDSVVRDEHRMLDSHPPIEVGEQFKVGDHEAPAPGQFDSVGMNVNCRCTLLPVIDEE